MSDDVMLILGRIEGELKGLNATVLELKDKGCDLGHKNSQDIAVINARSLGIGGLAGAVAGGVILAGKMIITSLINGEGTQ